MPYNNRSQIIRSFKEKNIKPLISAPDAKSDEVEKSEQKLDESIRERVKLRRPKADKTDDEQLDTTDMSDLESEKSAEQRRDQSAKGLKILTPQQMLSRLSLSLAQLKAGDSSKKLKNEIRQVLHSLYKSKKLSKTIYNNLINAI